MHLSFLGFKEGRCPREIRMGISLCVCACLPPAVAHRIQRWGCCRCGWQERDKVTVSLEPPGG